VERTIISILTIEMSDFERLEDHRQQVLLLPMSLRVAYLSMHRSTNQLLKSLGITADQYVCLFILKEHGDLIQSEIVRHIDSDANTMKAMLLLLENRGFVVRKVNASDRRAKLVSITEKGSNVVDDASRILYGIHDRVEQQLNEVEATAMNTLLKRYAQLMAAGDGGCL